MADRTHYEDPAEVLDRLLPELFRGPLPLESGQAILDALERAGFEVHHVRP